MEKTNFITEWMEWGYWWNGWNDWTNFHVTTTCEIITKPRIYVRNNFFSRIKYIHNVWNPAANEMVSMKILLLLHHFTLPLNCGVKREGNGKSSPWNLVIFTLILNLCGSTYLLYTSQTNRCGLVAHIWYWVRGWCPEATFIRFSC